MKELLFRNEAMRRSFSEKGYVLFKNVLEHAEIKALSDFIKSLNISFNKEFYYSLLSNSSEENLRINAEIQKRLLRLKEQLFLSCLVRNASFLAKPAGDEAELFLHQDWFFTDTENFQTGTLWIPLCDVSEKNGAMFLIPGSHNYFSNIISGNLPTARISSAALLKDKVVPLRLNAGDALIFHPAVFHGSFANNSSTPRIAVTANLFPVDAPFFYYHKLSDTAVAKYTLSDDDILKDLQSFVDGRIDKNLPHEVITYMHFVPTEKDLIEQKALMA